MVSSGSPETRQESAPGLTLARFLVVLSLFILCSPSLALAKGDDDTTLKQIYGAAEVSYASIAQDDFIQTHLKLGLMWQTKIPILKKPALLRLDLHAPLRFRVVDAPPTDPLGLRQQDWDTWTDALRILRYAGLRDDQGTFHLALGELGAFDLGHGTIISQYFNNIALDHYKMGAQFYLRQTNWGMSVVTDEVIDPHLIAARMYRVVGVPQLQVGLSFVADLDAPIRLALSPNTGQNLSRDAAYHPIIEEDQLTVLWGVDMQWDFIEEGPLSLSQYLDINWHTQVGVGAHLGLDFGFDLAGILSLVQRAEINVSQGGYIPRYVGPMYDIDRFWFPQWGQSLALPKLTFAGQLQQDWAIGFMSQTQLVTSWVTADFTYTQRGQDTSTAMMMARLSTSELAVLRAQVAAIRHGASEIFTKKDALVFAEATTNLTNWLYLVGRYDLLWRLDHTGNYAPTDALFAGIGVRMVLR